MQEVGLNNLFSCFIYCSASLSYTGEEILVLYDVLCNFCSYIFNGFHEENLKSFSSERNSFNELYS